MRTIAVVNLKGGSAKTTSAAFLAHAFAERGLRVLVVDADPQGQSLRWSEAAEWSIPTLALPVKDLHKRLTGIVPTDTDLVIIDTPPLEEQAGIVYSALRASDGVIISMAPTMAELDRLPDVWDAVAEVEPLTEKTIFETVLLNRVVANAGSTEVVREAIDKQGKHVLVATISRREHYAQAFKAPIDKTLQYADAAREIAQEMSI